MDEKEIAEAEEIIEAARQVLKNTSALNFKACTQLFRVAKNAITALRSERAKLKAEIKRCDFLIDQNGELEQYTKKLKKDLQAETKALERAAKWIADDNSGNECPASKHGATWVCDKIQSKFYNDDSCSMEGDEEICWAEYFRGEK